MVLATRLLVVEAMAVSIDASDAVAMGHSLGIRWNGPGARRDRIEIWDADAKAGRGGVVAAKRVVSGYLDGRRVEFIVPVKPGN